MTVERFEAKIAAARGGGALVEVPEAVVAALGGGGRIPVRAQFDGVPYQGWVASMGGQMVIGLLQSIRAELGKDVGDTVAVELLRDEKPRTVEIPDDVRAALEDAGAAEAFARLSSSKQRTELRAVEEAKRPETRTRRITQLVERLIERLKG